MRKFVLITVLLALIFAGCSGEVEEVKPTPTPTPTVTPMHGSTPQHVPTMTPTAMPTHTPATPHTTPSPTPMQPTTTPTPFELEYGVKYKVLVVDVIDGDTIDVKLPDGTVERVRMLGVDTPETTASKNKAGEYDDIADLECLAQWGLNAKQFTQSRLDGKYVWIEFDSLAGMRGYYGRLLAYVYYPDENTDFTAELVKQGYARVYVEGKFAKEDEYLGYQNDAMSSGTGLWGTCAVATPTPAPTEASTSGTCVYIVRVNYDAPGNDNENPNGEYVVLKNSCSNPVNLAGWVLEDDAGHKYVFPSYTMNSGETLYIYSGSGVDSTGKLYWGYDRAIWNNGGDTAYLYDSSGNLIDSYSW